MVEPILIPLFYRYTVQQCKETDFRLRGSEGPDQYLEDGLGAIIRNAEEAGVPTNDLISRAQRIAKVQEDTRSLAHYTGIENKGEATNDDTEEAGEKRENFVREAFCAIKNACNKLGYFGTE